MESHSQAHWSRIFSEKQPEEMSWTQPIPSTSLQFIRQFNLDPSARIIDIGGGDSRLVDFLLDAGFEHLTVLDISPEALERAKIRLGDQARRVEWVVSDITAFNPTDPFDFWHDRAAFHFLTSDSQIGSYLTIARKALRPNGGMMMGTFSETGPERCSGLPVRRYSEASLTAQLKNGFQKLRCVTEDHRTPFRTTQNFLFCSFRRVD